MIDRGSPAALAFTFSCAVHIAAVAAIAASLLADPGVPFILEPPCDPEAATRPTLTWTFVTQSPPQTDQLQASVLDTTVDPAFDVEVGQDAEQIVITESVPGMQPGVEGGLTCDCVGGIVGGWNSEIDHIGLLIAVETPTLPATPIRLRGAAAPAKLVDVAPKYPPLARQARIEGVVVIDLTIDERGLVLGVEVLRSVSALDRAATDAVRQWRYAPALVNGHPVSVVMTVTVVFSLQSPEANHSPKRAV